MSIVKTHVRNVGTAAVKALVSNQNRKALRIVNKHATQTLQYKFGSDFVASDVTEVQKIAFSGVPDAGDFKVRWNGNDSTAIAYDDNAAAIETILQAVSGLGSVTVAGSYAAGFTITMTGATPSVDPDLPLLEVVDNTLNIALVQEVQTIAFGNTPDVGSFKLAFNGKETPAIAFDDDAAAVQVALRTIIELAAVTVSGDFASGFDVTFVGGAVYGDQPLLTVLENTLQVTEVQNLAFSAVPDAGEFTLGYDSEETAAIAFDDDAAALQVALRALTGLEAVTVTGDFSSGFDVTFVGVTGDVDLLTEETNTLEESLTPVTITITEDTAGELTTVTPSEDTAGSPKIDVSTTVTEETKGAYVDGVTVAAAGGTATFGNGGVAPIDDVWLKASGADTRVELIEEVY